MPEPIPLITVDTVEFARELIALPPTSTPEKFWNLFDRMVGADQTDQVLMLLASFVQSVDGQPELEGVFSRFLEQCQNACLRKEVEMAE